MVKPRLDVAAQLGVSVQSISQTIRIATLGDLPQNGAKFSLRDRQIPIRVSLIEKRAPRPRHPGESAGPDGIGRRGAAENASRIFSFGQGPSVVRRYNQSRRFRSRRILSPG